MSLPPAGMSDTEIEALMNQVSLGAVTPKTAIALLVLNGEKREKAARRVFYALGGSDATELDAQGRACYVSSGKLVVDVERAIES